jgi:hypothetical protein
VIITTNLAFGEWSTVFGEMSIVMLDRLFSSKAKPPSAVPRPG